MLDRKSFNFDPIFPEEFFRIKKKEVKLTYKANFPVPTRPNDKSGENNLEIDTTPATLGAFFSSNEGQQFKQGFKDTIDKLISWAKANGINSAPFNKFYGYHSYAGNDQIKNETYFGLYSVGVALLAGIVELIKLDDIPFSKRHKVITYMASEMAKCEPGLYTIISNAYLELIAPSNLYINLMVIRRTLGEQCLLRLISQRDRHNYPGNEIHHVNAVLNDSIEALGINYLEDPYIARCCKPAALDALKKDFINPTYGFATVLTVENILTNLLTDLPLDATIEELNLASKLEKVILQINQAIISINSNYFANTEETTSAVDPQDKQIIENLKKDLKELIVKFEPELKQYKKTGNIILENLNNILSNVVTAEAIPKLDPNVMNVFIRFDNELDHDYGIDNLFYDRNEIFISEDFNVTYQKSWKAESIMFLSLFERLRNNKYLVAETPVEYKLPILDASVNLFPGRSIKLAYIKLQKPTFGEKSHQPFLSYCVEMFLTSKNEKQKELITFIRTNLKHEHLEELKNEIVKYLKSTTHTNADEKETEQRSLIEAIHQIFDDKRFNLIFFIGLFSPDNVRLFVEKMSEEKILELAKANPDKFLSLYGSAKSMRICLKQGLFQDIEDKDGNTPLKLAIKANRADVVMALLENGANIYARNSDIIFLAAKSEMPILAMLLDTGLDPNYNASTKTLLLSAIEGGRLENVQLLLENGADPNRPLDPGNQPLFAAIEKGDAKIVEALLSRKEINLDIENRRGVFPLSRCLNKPDILELLLKAGVAPDRIDKEGDTALSIAVTFEYIESIQILLKTNNVNVNHLYQHGFSLLSSAVKEGRYIKATQLLLTDKKIDPNIIGPDGMAPIHYAVTKKNGEEFTEALLKNENTNPNIRDQNGFTPLYHAIKNNSLKSIKLLLAHPKIDFSELAFPLHWAVKTGSVEIVQCLIDKGIDPTLLDDKNNAPLHLAVDNDNLAIIKLLLAIKEANPNITDKQGRTPLHHSVMGVASEATMTALLPSGEIIDPNILDNAGLTPLHYAIEKNYLHAVNILLAHHKTDPNIHIPKTIHSPLNMAILYGNLKVVQALLDHEKINLTTPGNPPITPLYVALHRNHLGMSGPYNAIEMLKVLLANKKHHDAIYKEAITHLFDAVKSDKDLDVVYTLMGAGIPLTVKDENGNTPLNIAIAHANVSAIKMMISGNDAEILKQEAILLLFRATEQGNTAHIETINKAGISFSSLYKNDRAFFFAAIKTGQIDLVKALPMIDPALINELLFAAVEECDVTIVEIFLKADVSANLINQFSNSLLKNATRTGCVAMVSLLLEHGADPITANACRVAAALGYVDVIKILLADKTYHPVIYQDANTLLFWAATQAAGIDVINILLKAGISPEEIDSAGNTILSIAAKHGHVGTIEALLQADTHQTVFQAQARHLFFTTDDAKIFNILLRAGVSFDKDENGKTRLELAIEKNQSAIIHAFFNHATKKQEVIKLLFSSIEKGDVGNVKCLASLAGIIAFTNVHDLNPLRFAIQLNQIKIVKVILGFVPQEAENLLLTAVEKGQIETVRVLLEAGLSPEIRNTDKNTLLHLAVLGNFPAIADLLLKHNADPNLKNGSSSTPLLWATQNGNRSMARLLLENKADPNLLNNDGRAPLLHAAEMGNVEMVELLLKYGANPTIDSNGDTPAKLAIKNGHLEITRTLQFIASLRNENEGTSRRKAYDKLMNTNDPIERTKAFTILKEIGTIAQQYQIQVLHKNSKRNKVLKEEFSYVINVACSLFGKNKFDESLAELKEGVLRIELQAKTPLGTLGIFRARNQAPAANPHHSSNRNRAN